MKVYLSVFFLALFCAVGVVQASQALDKAKADYQYQLDTYRSAYDEFLLKRTQFENTSSFANQEEMVKAAKDMLTRRARVWKTYWQVLRVDTWETEGLNPAMRDELIGEIDEIQVLLNEHEINIPGINNREPLLAEAIAINLEDLRFENSSYKVLFELEMARFDWAMRQLKEFHNTLDAAIEVQVRSNSEKQLKKRGLEEVISIINRLGEVYDEIGEDLRRPNKTRKYIKIYKNMVDELSPYYSDMIRVNDLLVEISEGIEL